eukprot:CAMPEP_0206462460 /NCGR_PEP_ID=MMETSP0324_2-20121206/25994_1 /ASSEMBLY_ACC=CAM_ASM_000836 /TAXON_ID=2866 /ORGANISM="Crypthecodinium cohnii, Strain Seligo" /LENGTH=110 /DNA_ID=CAMNT_0053934625 /DNA_START=38 /DNA_END=372 /DNA_ORIENTATION=-
MENSGSPQPLVVEAHQPKRRRELLLLSQLLVETLAGMGGGEVLARPSSSTWTGGGAASGGGSCRARSWQQPVAAHFVVSRPVVLALGRSRDLDCWHPQRPLVEASAVLWA